jgi:hypothetical protein
MKRLWQFVGATCVAVACTLGAGQAQAQLDQSIVNSPHNLATQTTATGDVCVFCHTPHTARPAGEVEAPLWNKPDGTAPAAFTTYDSSTLDGTILAVGSVSAACLTCHDGQQAMDTVINAPGTDGIVPTGQEIDAGAIGTIAGVNGGAANLGQDLSNDHPIGAPYGGGFTTAPATADPDFVAPVSATINGQLRWWVDTGGTGIGTREKTDMILYSRADGVATDAYVECGSCHDPHVGEAADTAGNTAGSAVSFLRIDNTDSAVCTTCHNK